MLNFRVVKLILSLTSSFENNEKKSCFPGKQLLVFYALMYIAFLISSFTFSSFGNHSANSAAE